MRIVLVLLFLTANSLVFGQSDKKIIKQLSAQLLLEQQKQDSAYAIFQKAKKEYDSIRRLLTEKTLRLSVEYGLAESSGELFFKRCAQLKDLGLDADAVAAPLTKTDGLPDFRQVLAPIDKFSMKAEEFDKVANSFFHDKDTKRKELIAIVRKKLIEYQDNERSNEVRLITMERKGEQLTSFLYVIDSLQQAYKLVNNELESKNAKLRDKLHELRINYKEKGPKGFPEAYQKVFYDAFPRSVSETSEEAIKNIHSEGMKLDEVVAEPVLPEPEIYEQVDEVALFPGGPEARKEFVSKNLRYPDKYKEIAVEGKVVLKFIVSEKGEISDIKVRVNFPGCKECDDEVVRIAQLMPHWIPARLNGKAVKSYAHLIVRFELD